MVKNIKKIYTLLSRSERRQLAFLFLAIVSSGIIQVVGIASIIPFVTTAANPEVVETNQKFIFIKNYLDLSSNQLLLLFGLIALSGLLLTNFLLTLEKYLTMKFVVNAIHSMSYSMLNKYANEDYAQYINKNSSFVIANITTEIDRLVNGTILPLINILAKTISASFILIFLLIINPTVTFILVGIFLVGYLIIYHTVKAKLQLFGKKTTSLFEMRLRLVVEILGGFKDLRIMGRTETYLDAFRMTSRKIVGYQIFNRAAQEIPKHIMEIFAFGSIVIVTIVLTAQSNKEANLLSIMAIFAFSGYRLNPILQITYQSYAKIKYNIGSVGTVYDDLVNNRIDLGHISTKTAPDPLALTDSLVVDKVSFRYEEKGPDILSNISIKIDANSIVALVGKSGSGKSTLIDIILGLLEPNQGALLSDRVVVSGADTSAWQANIGYVPQAIFLANLSVTENIAFGVPSINIDMDAVVSAARSACIHEFITNELRDSYETRIGERGVKLSGGQRQRIGIARALYHDPQLLILDEATSALDSPTEQAIVNEIRNLGEDKTIIMVAHRISTVQNCDKIFVLDSGKVVGDGDYDSLIASNSYFKDLVNSIEMLDHNQR